MRGTDRYKTINPSHLWYIVGLIATDGNLSKDGRHINITSKDIDFLENICEVLMLGVKVGRKARGSELDKNYGNLQFSDVRFYDYLLQIGLTPAKSLTLGPINVAENHFIDFLRGVIDGDGNIHRWIHPQNGNEQWELRIYSCAAIFIQWLFIKIQNDFGVKGILVSAISNRKNRYYVMKFGKMAAREILRKCYYPKALALNRKAILAQECIDSYVGWKKSVTVKI